MIESLLNTDDPEEWIGKSISIRPDKTQNPEGALVDCIRVDFELTEQGKAQAVGEVENAFGAAARKPNLSNYPNEGDDGIPF